MSARTPMFTGLLGLGFASAIGVSVVAQGGWVERPEIQPRTGATAAYDSSRGRVVVFGGFGVSMLDETLEWDGQAWAVRDVAMSPPARWKHGIAYDVARAETVMFGGLGMFGNSVTAATWLWDGFDWIRRAPITTPSVRRDHVMVYDPVRQRTVLFGGSAATELGDTWEWDGDRWIQRNPGVAPSPRSRHGMAWDPVSRRVILFGGSSAGDTWAWDGATWVQLQPNTSPPASIHMNMATDTVRQRVVAYVWGGQFGGPRVNQTWEWDGTNWSQVMTTATSGQAGVVSFAFDGVGGKMLAAFGSARNRANTSLYDGTDWARADVQLELIYGVMASDVTRERIVMVNSATTIGKTWEWDGERWSFLTPANPLPWSLLGPAMTFDRARQRTVLFGGRILGIPTSDHREWDGVDWIDRPLANRPSPRVVAGMAYDSARQLVLLFGGFDGAQALSDTWTWNGSAWNQRSPMTVPPALDRPQLAFDQRRGRMVLFGSVAASGQTWEWDGADWTQAAPTRSPGPSSSQSMAFDEALGRCVWNDGNETWEWDGVDWTQDNAVLTGGVGLAWDARVGRLLTVNPGGSTWVRGPVRAAAASYGAGCSGSRGTPGLAARGLPFIGSERFRLELTSVRANGVAAILLAAQSAAIPVGGCTLLVGANSVALGLASNPHGFAELALSIPPVVQLSGAMVFGQGFAADANGAGLGAFSSSNGLRLTIGD